MMLCCLAPPVGYPAIRYGYACESMQGNALRSLARITVALCWLSCCSTPLCIVVCLSICAIYPHGFIHRAPMLLWAGYYGGACKQKARLEQLCSGRAEISFVARGTT